MSKYDDLKRYLEVKTGQALVDSREILELIAENERLAAENDRLTAGRAENCRSLKKQQADIDQKVLSHLRSVPGSTAWAMRGAINATREDISKACQRLKRKGLVICDGAYWKEAAK